jgi:CRISPR-associated protein Cas2
MLELGPGVYTAARISPAVRARIWDVLSDWFYDEENASIVMVWDSIDLPAGQSVRVLGIPPVELVERDGIVLTKRTAVATESSPGDP